MKMAMVESLEPRQLFSRFILDSGVLFINGGSGNDHMAVTRRKDSLVLFNAGEAIAAFKQRDVTAIIMFGNGGNDRLSANVRVPVTLVGGEGRDTLIGGSADDVLVGGPGHDVLLGRGGNDILRGDDGNDQLFGDAGDDLLFAGPGNNRVDGGRGNDTVMRTPGASDRERAVELEQPDTFRPAGRAFPEPLALVAADASVSVVGRVLTVGVSFAATGSTQVLLANHLRQRGRTIELSGLVLSGVAPTTTSPILRTLTRLRPGEFTFVLNGPEGTVESTPFSVLRIRG